MFRLHLGRMGGIGRIPFSPRQLFAAGEQGAWYKPSLMNGSIYQDSGGTLPVTAIGQPDGLMLDNRLGLVMGAELVPNGTFDTDITGWAPLAQAALTAIGGALRVSLTANGFARARTGAITTVIGKTYLVTARVVSKVATGLTSLFLGVSSSADAASAELGNTPTVSAGGEMRIVFIGTGTQAFIKFGTSSGWLNGDYVDFDNISVCEIPGSHALQTTAAARPLYQSSPERLVFDGVDDAHVTTFATALGSNCTVVRSLPTVGTTILTGQTIGTTYTNTATHSGLIVIDRPLTAAETLAATRWGNQRAGV